MLLIKFETMKLRKLFVFTLFISLSYFCFAQIAFDNYFETKSMRIDYYFAGNNNTTEVYFIETKEEPFWGGPKKNLIDSFNYGNFRLQVFSKESNELIYSKGFSSLFQEWQTTGEAKEVKRSFYQTSVIPFPKDKIRFEISQRERNGKFKVIFEKIINPKNYFILREPVKKVETERLFGNFESDQALDIAFIAEGYTQNEMEKFITDVQRMSNYLFETEPFNLYKDQINIWAVKAISQESGTDIPGDNIYKNTALNSSYYTFDIPRYLTTYDIKSIYDYAANVPYDQVYVLINTNKYGGGGIYNYYTACTSDNSLSKEVFIHEFGHGFGGLGDEYYTSSVAYEDFYNLEIEPWEPNLTTLIDFDSKWKRMIASTTPIPTPREEKYKHTTGVYEGGGYMSKGIYSPAIDCRMKSNISPGFCPVCNYYLEKMILFYLDKK